MRDSKTRKPLSQMFRDYVNSKRVNAQKEAEINNNEADAFLEKLNSDLRVALRDVAKAKVSYNQAAYLSACSRVRIAVRQMESVQQARNMLNTLQQEEQLHEMMQSYSASVKAISKRLRKGTSVTSVHAQSLSSSYNEAMAPLRDITNALAQTEAGIAHDDYGISDHDIDMMMDSMLTQGEVHYLKPSRLTKSTTSELTSRVKNKK